MYFSHKHVETWNQYLNYYMPLKTQVAKSYKRTKELKETLQEDEFLILFDFADNFAIIVQNAIQSQHWNNDQTTIKAIVNPSLKWGFTKDATARMMNNSTNTEIWTQVG